MLRTKDQKLDKDVRIIELMKRLGKPLPEDYQSSLKALTDSEKNSEEIVLTGDDEEEVVVETKKKKK